MLKADASSKVAAIADNRRMKAFMVRDEYSSVLILMRCSFRFVLVL